ncbi:MAG: hypothetical protein R2687_10295 [Candidatus Nanopelagicales bacterium]
MKKLVALLAALSATAGSIGIAAPAQAKTIKACVKKSDGTLKILKKKKCKKGWKKVTWGTKGPAGQNGSSGSNGVNGVPGPAGPSWVVKDEAGKTLGTFAGYGFGLLPLVSVIAADGGVFGYAADGKLQNNNADLFFRNNACTDAAWWSVTSSGLREYLDSAGGAGRAVFQVTGAPTASAWKVDVATTTTTYVPGNTLFKKNATTGACAANANPAGYIVPLTSAPAPVVAATGPLSIVR